MQIQEVGMSPSPLGETLRRARTSKKITLEDAERVTRIPRKYLEALEIENFGILPAPVYARGFLRSYATYLGLEPKELLPFFPVGHVDEPALDPLPEVNEPRTWNMNGLIAMAVVGALILIVVALYSLGHESSSAEFINQHSNTVITGDNTGQGSSSDGGVKTNLPDLVGQTEQEAIQIIQDAGATAVITRVTQGDVPTGQVISQDPGPGTDIGANTLVNITVAK
ncbi:MAG TPA: helix-turn-helix domain-containing protein [Dehalococcoidia bacterium]|nr:helix-turn-helix domain-containing protein [Dehalococcoidia bacterium]